MSRPKTPMCHLDGKDALVDCASSGIGLACAVALAEAGAHATLAARRANKLEELASKIKARKGSADILPLDVSDADAIAVGIDGAKPFDICHNAASQERAVYCATKQAVKGIWGVAVNRAADASALMRGTHLMRDGGWTAD